MIARAGIRTRQGRATTASVIGMVVLSLVDTLVRQSMVMVARLATSGGYRSPLTHVADQIFAELTKALREQGLAHKVIADMFGMSIRAYYEKLKRADEAQGVRQRSLWQTVWAYLIREQVVPREKLLQRFRQEDPSLVVGMVNDLVAQGWVYRRGEGEQVVYRVQDTLDTSLSEAESVPAVAAMVWALLREHGPKTQEELQKLLPSVPLQVLASAAKQLEEQGNLTRGSKAAADAYVAEAFRVPLHQAQGWAGAVAFHFRAVVNTLCAKAEEHHRGEPNPHVGGSTFSYDVGGDHPLREAVLAQLEILREMASKLREEVDAYNQTHPREQRERVTFYLGQYIEQSASDAHVPPQERQDDEQE